MSVAQSSNNLAKVVPTTHTENSTHCIISRAGGRKTSTTIVLNANNTSANVNVYQITGTIKVYELCAEITDATTLTNCTAVYYDLYDGTNSPDITLAAGITLSGLAVGTYFLKNEVASQALSLADNSQCRVTEATDPKKSAAPFDITQKTGTNTYVRFNYTTTDAPIDAEIDCYIIWEPVNGGTLVAV